MVYQYTLMAGRSNHRVFGVGNGDELWVALSGGYTDSTSTLNAAKREGPSDAAPVYVDADGRATGAPNTSSIYEIPTAAFNYIQSLFRRPKTVFANVPDIYEHGAFYTNRDGKALRRKIVEIDPDGRPNGKKTIVPDAPSFDGQRRRACDFVRAAVMAGARVFGVENGSELYTANSPSSDPTVDLSLAKRQGAYSGDVYKDGGNFPTGHGNVITVYEIPERKAPMPVGPLGPSVFNWVNATITRVGTSYGVIKYLGCVVDSSDRVGSGTAVDLGYYPANERLERAMRKTKDLDLSSKRNAWKNMGRLRFGMEAGNEL